MSQDGVERALTALRGYQSTALGTAGPDGPHVAGVFFAPEPDGDGIRLLLAVLRGTRKLEQLTADPRVAFLCSPGQPVSWVQGSGTATIAGGRDDLLARVVAHAPGARAFVERLPVAPVVIAVRRIRVVEAVGVEPLVLELPPGGAV